MKKLLSVTAAALIFVLLFALAGCKSKPADDPAETVTIRVAALKGPTAIGMVHMLSENEGASEGNLYDAAIYGTADEVAALLINEEVDIAAVPCNLASVLYNKTEGEIVVAGVNVLGVLYVVENGDSVQSIEDLRGKTVYSTGQGTTPEYVLRYILSENGIDPDTDLTIEYKSESTEIAALLSSADETVIAVLPQPYITTVRMQNDAVRIALDLTAEWEAVSETGSVVTGTVVARREFIEEHPEAFETFLVDCGASVEWVIANPAEAAVLVEEYGIVKAAVAEQAIPFCNLVFLTGEEMQQKISGYLTVLFEQNPSAVGGALPDDAFYYG